MNYFKIAIASLGLLLPLLLLPLACTSPEDQTSYEIAYVDHDSLAQFDSIQILLVQNGLSLEDTLFTGPLKNIGDLNHLKVSGTLQGTVHIIVRGFNGDSLAFERLTLLDADKHTITGTDLVHSPKGSIHFDSPSLKLNIGDTLDLPGIVAAPAEWAQKPITYGFQEIKVIALITKNRLVGLARGSARIVATLVGDTSVTDTLLVQVVDPLADKIHVKVSPDTLNLTVQGASFALIGETTPVYSPLTWSSANEKVATVDVNGLVRGMAEGATWIRAHSVTDTTSCDSSWVIVTATVPVASVHFLRSSLVLFVGGAADSIPVFVLPTSADPATGLRIIGNAVTLSGRRFIPVDTGSALAIAYSLRDTSKTDTLRITVRQAVVIQSFKVEPDTLRLYLGGPDSAFSVSIEPTAAGKGAVWHLGRIGIARITAAGKVTALSEGQVGVEAQALADSSKRDTSLIQVIRDIPKLTVGNALVTSPGTTVDFTPKVEQEFGGVTGFWWDLDGNGIWDDSSDGLKTVSRKFDAIGEVVTQFKVRDAEGNEGPATRKVTTTKGPLVVILDPPDGFVTNKKTISVNWEVDHVKQDKQTQEQLTQEGPKTVVRSAKDTAGNETVVSITVFLDTKAPERPLVRAITPTKVKTPTFAWHSGGGNGAGEYRFQIDAEPGTSQTESSDTTITWPADLSPGGHTLFVQERDTAGNWSASGSGKVVIDVTAPPAPTVKAISGPNSNKVKVTFVWQGADEGVFRYQYQIDKEKFEGSAIDIADTTATLTLTEGLHVFYVQQLDSAGNTSPAGKTTVNIDVTAPNKPLLRSLTGPWSTDGKPTWIWKTGGGAGNGQFRYRLDTSDLSGKNYTSDTAFSPKAVLSEGPHLFYVQERDSVGNASPVESLTVTVDTKAPTAPLCLEPGDMAWVKTQRPTWKWKGGGGGDGRYYAFIAGNGGPDTATRTTDTTVTPTTDLKEGTWTLGVRAYDAAGNASPLALCPLRIDVTPPATPTSDTGNHPWVTSVLPSRKWTQLGISIPALYRYKLDDPDLTTGATAFVGLGFWTATAPLTEGGHTLTVQEGDSAGNWSAPLSMPFKIDTTAPTAPILTQVQPGPSITCAPSTSSATLWRYQVTADAKTNLYQLDSASLNNPVVSPATVSSYDIPAGTCLTEGTHSFNIRTVDSAGLQSPIASVSTKFITPIEATGLTGAEANGLNLGVYGTTFSLGFISGSGDGVHILTGKSVDDKLSNLGPISSIALPNYLRMAVGPKGEIGFIDGNTSNKVYELRAYIGGVNYAIGLPKWSNPPTWFALDFNATGDLILAYNNMDAEGTLSVCTATNITTAGKTVACAIQAQKISSVNATHIFISARTATATPTLIALVNANGLPEIYGQTTVGDYTSFTQIKTGLEDTRTNHFGIGFAKSTLGLMGFSPTGSPWYQTFTYKTTWVAGKIQTTPFELGKGMGVMDLDPSGRPFVVMGGRMWGYNGGNWYSVSNGHDFSDAPMLDLKVRPDGSPLLFYSTGKPPGGLNANLLRTGFDMPVQQAK